MSNIEIKWLEISSCGLSKLENIEQFPALEYLNAIGNNLESSQIAEYKELLKSINEVEF